MTRGVRGGDHRRIGFGRLALLGAVALSLYLLAPSVTEVLASWRELSGVAVYWFVVVLACQVLSFLCVFALLRLVLRISDWFLIATSQLAGNAVSRIVPAGAAAGAALQFRMLAHAGADGAVAVAGLSALSLLQFASVLALPLLTLPAVLGGAYVDRGLVQSALLGVAAFVLVAVLGALVLATDAPLAATGRAVQAVHNRFVKGKRMRGLPGQLLRQRDGIRRALGRRRTEASLAMAGRLGFDFLSLLAALEAAGAHPVPSLVLLAFSASVVLSMIPITPGGLGFVEAGLTSTLALAGVPAADAVLATLIYRLGSYWLPILAGPVAYALFRRRYP
jgi:uncharacterized protein (TIRG00374 family)